MNNSISILIKRFPWIWACLGSLICYLAISILTSSFGFESLLTNAAIASLLAIVALGQMFAISSGDGGIDLSVPYIITLSSFLSFGIIQGSNGNLFKGILVIIFVGLFVGLLNSVAIIIFEIPPIIATMAMGFIVNTAILLYSTKFSSFKSSSLLSTIANGRLLGVPIILIFALICVLIVVVLLNTMTYGRAIMAVGQNRLASYFAGIQVNKTIMIAYMISGLFASIGGALIGARVNGAFLDMGQPYMLQSVGAVVIGGTLISGGKSTGIGTAFGALFLILLVTLMLVSHLSVGVQYIVEGIVLILVLAIGGNQGHTD